jgi:hypothetical protein
MKNILLIIIIIFGTLSICVSQNTDERFQTFSSNYELFKNINTNNKDSSAYKTYNSPIKRLFINTEYCDTIFLYNKVITNDTIVIGCYVHVKNISVQNEATLIINAENLFIDSDFEVELGSEFVLEPILFEYNNPFSHYAYLHNFYLDKLLTVTNIEVDDPYEIIEIMRNIVLITDSIYLGGEFDELALDFFDCLYINFEAGIFEIFTQMINNFIQKGYLNNMIKENLVDYMFEILELSEKGELNTSFSIYKRIVELEWSVLKNDSLPELEKESLMMFMAAFKEGFLFWDEYWENKGMKNWNVSGLWFSLLADLTAMALCATVPYWWPLCYPAAAAVSYMALVVWNQ